MVLGRCLKYSLALLLLISGCASIQNTLAQDLADERIRACSHVQEIKISRVERDGHVWATYTADHRLAFNAWNQCMQQAAAEQAQRETGTVVPPRAVISASTVRTPSDSTNGVPVWKPGYAWAYRFESPAGNGTYVWSVDREEAIDGVPHYVIKSGTREIFYRKSDLASSRETVEGLIVARYTPSRLNYMWPLTVGQTWDQAMQEERPKDRQTSERMDTLTVESEESVTVPAGTFKTLKVVCWSKQTGAIRYEQWYSPDTKLWVKIRENLDSGLRVRELIAFKVR